MSKPKHLNTKPFAHLKAALDTAFPLNSLVMFENDGRPYIGYISGTEKGKYIVTVDAERKFELTAVRIHKLPGAIPEAIIKSNGQNNFIASLHELQPIDDLEKLWQKALSSRPGLWAEKDLCELLHGSVQLNDYIELRLALIGDKIYFGRDKEGFIPRTESGVADQLQIAARKKEKESNYLILAKYIDSKEKDKIPEEAASAVKLLSEIAVRCPLLTPDEIREAEELIVFLENYLKLQPSGNLDARAYHLAVKAKAMKRDTNLAYIKHRTPMQFSKEVLEAAEKINLPTEIKDFQTFQSRRDLTSLDAFTIDDESTKDMDDALSIEETDNGYTIGIHIIDVAQAIPKDSPLDVEAERRATSIYCPDSTINMFPEKLSHDVLSLKAGVVRPCISCIVEVDKNFKPAAADVVLSFIKVKRRLSYIEADELLYKNDRVLSILHQIAGALEEGRIEKGAMRVVKRDIVPVPTKNDIRLVDVDETAPSRHLVGEMMILANSIMANFFLHHSIPALFRTQDRPDPIDASAYKLIPPGPALEHFERTRLKRSLVGLRSGFHATLGLSAYVQITSPIRRYIDLCLQRQLSSYLLNEIPSYTAEDLEKIQAKVEEPLMRAVYVARESKRYWILRYLERYLHDGKPVSGIIVRADSKTTLVELDEVFLTFHARIQKPKLGHRAVLKISHIDPRTDYIRLEERRR